MKLFDLIQDKRLMQVAGGTPTGPTSGAATDMSGTEDQALLQRIEQAGSPAEAQRQIAEYRALVARRAAAERNAGTVANSEVAAQAAVQTRAASDSQQNAADAARNGQEVIKDSLLRALGLFNQSATGLMQAEQSIEQTKAGISGMIQILGVIAQHFGAEDFGRSCLELATKLNPQLVEPNATALAAIEGYRERVNMDPSITQAYINQGQESAADAATRAQAAVNQAAINGVANAGNVPQPTALDAVSGGSSPAPSSITSTSFSRAMDRILTDATEKSSLNTAFEGIARQGGNVGEIDTPTERASIAAAVRGNIADPTRETRVLQELSLAGGPS